MPMLDLLDPRPVMAGDLVEAAAACDLLQRQSVAGADPSAALAWAVRDDELRRDAAPFYLFARGAHTLARSEQPRAQRLLELDAWGEALRRAYHGRSAAAEDGPIFVALAEAARRRRVPIAPLVELLDALRVEICRHSFATMEQLVEHCRRSAGACGRLLVYLAGQASPQRLARVDDLGVALRLVDVIEDLQADAREGRVFVPAAELAAFGVTPDELAEAVPTEAVEELVAYLISYARGWLARARPLLRLVQAPLRGPLVELCRRGRAALNDGVAPGWRPVPGDEAGIGEALPCAPSASDAR